MNKQVTAQEVYQKEQRKKIKAMRKAKFVELVRQGWNQFAAKGAVMNMFALPRRGFTKPLHPKVLAKFQKKANKINMC